MLKPSVEAVIHVLKKRDAVRVQPTGAYAANLLGLSTQVPARVVLLTDGPSRQINLGKSTIRLKRTTPRNMATAGRPSGLVIQALRWIGRRSLDDSTVQILRRALTERDRRGLLADLRHAPVWIADIMRRVAQDGGE